MIRAQNDLYMVVNNNGAEVNAGEIIPWRRWRQAS
jgi:hypothetical protein